MTASDQSCQLSARRNFKILAWPAGQVRSKLLTWVGCYVSSPVANLKYESHVEELPNLSTLTLQIRGVARLDSNNIIQLCRVIKIDEYEKSEISVDLVSPTGQVGNHQILKAQGQSSYPTASYI